LLDASGEGLDLLRGRGREECCRSVGAGDAGEIALILIVCEEPEELVFAQGATCIEAPLFAHVGRLERRGDEFAGGGAGGDGGERIGSAPGAVAVVEKKLAVNVVAAALRHGVDDASSGASVFC